MALLPDIERSAASLFAGLPDLKHLAGGAVIELDGHNRFLADGCLWVAADGDTIVGFLAAELLDGNLHVRELSVCRKAQGCGHGRSLLDLAVNAAAQRGYSALTLTTFQNVPWNAPFYARYGFRIVEDDKLRPALSAIIAEELAHGMPAGSRCAMILPLN